MNIFITAFNTILYRPLLNVLVLLYKYLPGNDFGIAIIVLTLVTKFLLYPSSLKSLKSQKALQEIQPEIEKIQKQYKDDRTAQGKALMELYKTRKVSPFSGCLPLLFQLPILIALFRVFWGGLGVEQMKYLYSWVSSPSQIDPTFLGLVDLSQPNPVLAILAGASQFFQSKAMSPKKKNNPDSKPGFASIFQKQMLYIFPIITIFIVWRLPSAIALYWLVSTLFSTIQTFLVFKKRKNGTETIKQN